MNSRQSNQIVFSVIAVAFLMFASACARPPAGPSLPNVVSDRVLDAGVHVAGLAVARNGDVWLATTNYGNGPSGIIRIRPDGSIMRIARIESFNRVAVDSAGIAWFTVGAGSAGQQPKLVRVDGAGRTRDYPLQPEGNFLGIAIGSDGAPWFANAAAGDIGHVARSGAIEYYGPAANDPTEIATGADGNLWFTESNGNLIGRLNPNGAVTEFPIPAKASHASAIAASGDGTLWFCESATDKIGRVTPQGRISETQIPAAGAWPDGIAVARDGTVWFSELSTGKVGRIGRNAKIAEFNVPAGGYPGPMARAPDGSIWFASNGQRDAVLGITTARSRLIHFLPR